MEKLNCANHNDHDKLLSRLDTRVTELEKRVNEVEGNHKATEEKFIRIFDKLDEIIAIIKINQSRLPNAAWGVSGSIGGGVLVWLILEFLKR